MKKTLFAAAMVLTALFGAGSASAAVGDTAGTIYTTDILTQVDGLDIQSYCIDGETLIALEDLEPYGFTVYYNDNIRTVFVTKSGSPEENFHPSVSRGSGGGIAGSYYETDIHAVVNGCAVNAYAINGKMAAKVEELGAAGLSGIARHNYQMTFGYNDSERLLSLNTSLSQYGTADGAKQIILDYRLWQPIYCRILHSGGNMLAERLYGGLPHGGAYLDCYVSLDNGLIYNAVPIARRYLINMSEPVFSEDGDYLYFKNTDSGDLLLDYKQLELNSMHIMPLGEEDYERAANRIAESDYTFALDGTKLPLYSIGSADYVKAEDLIGAGFTPDEAAVRVYNSDEYFPLSEWTYDFGNPWTNTEYVYKYDPYGKSVTATKAEKSAE